MPWLTRYYSDMTESEIVHEFETGLAADTYAKASSIRVLGTVIAERLNNDGNVIGQASYWAGQVKSAPEGDYL